MAAKKTEKSVAVKQPPEILQDPLQYGFWKRLPYALTDEQKEFIRAIWDSEAMLG